MKNIVEINGRSYDAKTGRLLATKTSNNTINKAGNAVHPVAPINNGVVLDGVSRRKSFKKRPTTIQNKLNTLRPSSAGSITSKLPSSAKEPSRQTEKTKTLLRNIVKKPSITGNRVNSKVDLAKRTPPTRLDKAKQTMRSVSISRFNNINRHKPFLSSDLKVTKEPLPKNVVPESAPSITAKVSSKSNEQQVFNHPIVHANNHLLKKLPKDKIYRRVAKTLNVGTKTLAITSAALAILVFGCVLVYQKVPSVAMRVAANRAGFGGRLPSTIPAGFSFRGPIVYSKDSIALNYKSNSDSRKFAIVQRPSEWSSESLLTNYLLTSKLQYQTYHDSGLTVYVFNGGEATWVDKGIWYSIKGEGTLSFDQILSIASSM